MSKEIKGRHIATANCGDYCTNHITVEEKELKSVSYDKKHSLVFKPSSHRYKLDGEPCVGTTTFLKSSYPTSMGLISWMQGESAKHAFAKGYDYGSNATLPTKDMVERVIKESKLAWKEKAQEAADVGTICHSFAELRSTGLHKEALELLLKLKDVPQWPLIKSCTDKYLKWEEQNQGAFHSAEELIASPTYKYCGKYDLISERNGKLILSDYKTSKGIYTEQLIQLAAYRLALREWQDISIKGIEILRFGKEDGEFEVKYIDDLDILTALEGQAIRCKSTYDFIKKFDKE